MDRHPVTLQELLKSGISLKVIEERLSGSLQDAYFFSGEIGKQMVKLNRQLANVRTLRRYRQSCLRAVRRMRHNERK